MSRYLRRLPPEVLDAIAKICSEPRTNRLTRPGLIVSAFVAQFQIIDVRVIYEIEAAMKDAGMEKEAATLVKLFEPPKFDEIEEFAPPPEVPPKKSLFARLFG